VNGENSNSARVNYVRNIRRVTAAVAVAVVLSAALFVFRFGLHAHPHRVGLACIIAGIYVVVFGVVYSFVYRTQLAQAQKM
jgi:hypothetical protein